VKKKLNSPNVIEVAFTRRKEMYKVKIRNCGGLEMMKL
jgi:hypothetical protein